MHSAKSKQPILKDFTGAQVMQQGRGIDDAESRAGPETIQDLMQRY